MTKLHNKITKTLTKITLKKKKNTFKILIKQIDSKTVSQL